MDDLTAFDAAAQGLIDRGIVTRETAATEREELLRSLNGGELPENVPEAAYLAAPSPASLAQEVDPNLAAAFAGPDSPAGYSFDRVYGVKHNPESEAAFRNFLFAEGIPASLAQEVDRQAMRGAAADPPTAWQLEQGRQDAMAQLARTWGPDRDNNLAIARREIARMAEAQPQIMGILKRTGLGNSAWLAITLVNLARAKGRA